MQPTLYQGFMSVQRQNLIKTELVKDISYFYTAPWYGFGRSERVVGDHKPHKDFVFSSKVGRILKPGVVEDPTDFGMIDPLSFHVICSYSDGGIRRLFKDGLQRLAQEQINILPSRDIGDFQHEQKNSRHLDDLKQSGYKAMSELKEQGF